MREKRKRRQPGIVNLRCGKGRGSTSCATAFSGRRERKENEPSISSALMRTKKDLRKRGREEGHEKPASFIFQILRKKKKGKARLEPQHPRVCRKRRKKSPWRSTRICRRPVAKGEKKKRTYVTVIPGRADT